MSQDRQNSSQSQQHLTSNQKEAARRLGMTEKQYSEATAAQVKRGKINPKDIT